MKIFYIFILLLFVSCVLEPEKEYVFQDRIVYIETVTGDMPLLFSIAETMPGKLNNVYGVLFRATVYNPSDLAWYGYPELRIYTIEEEINMDSTFAPTDLLYKAKGVLCSGINAYTFMPIDTVAFVPTNGFRWAWVFVEVDYNEMKPYKYYLWRFVSDRK